jgi:hypothetical protein
MRSRDRRDTWGWCYHEASSVTANAYMQKARSSKYRYFKMRLQLDEGKGQRLLAVACSCRHKLAVAETV